MRDFRAVKRDGDAPAGRVLINYVATALARYRVPNLSKHSSYLPSSDAGELGH